VQLPPAFCLWITLPVRDSRRCFRAIPAARTPRWTQPVCPIGDGPRQPRHRDNIAAFGAQSVSMILSQHDYRTTQLGDSDRQSSRPRGGPVGISRGSGRRRASITNRRDGCHRGGWELSAIRQGAVTPRTVSCHGACIHAAIVLQTCVKLCCNVKYNLLK
jgi:hypothetical protein